MDDISSLKLADLKKELRARNLPITGTKQILVDRLTEAMSAEKAVADDSNIDDLIDEDSMLGEEDSDAEGTTDIAADLTISSPTATIPPVSLTSSPTKTAEAVKRTASSPLKNDQNGKAASSDAPPSKKKIILNREPVPEAAPQVLGVVNTPTAESVKAATENKPPVTDETGEKVVVKIAEVAAAPVVDKLKMRQEKFGIAAAAGKVPSGTEVSDRLKKRAERFGVPATGAAPTATVATPEDSEKLAKRRERFGVQTDDKIDELKNKRANRFGLAATGAKPSAEVSAEVEEKKKLRAARFAAAL